MKKTKENIADKLPPKILEQIKELDDRVIVPKSEFSYSVVKQYIDIYNSIFGSNLFVSSKSSHSMIVNKSVKISDGTTYSVTKLTPDEVSDLKFVTRFKVEQVWESLKETLPLLKQAGEKIRVPTEHISLTVLRSKLDLYNKENGTNFIARQVFGRGEQTKGDYYYTVMLDLPFYDTFGYQYTINKASPNIVKRLDDLNIQGFVVNDSLYIPEDFIPAQMVRNYATACSKFVDCKFSVNKSKDGVIITRIC